MSRALVLLVIGAAVGATVTFLWLHSLQPAPPTPLSSAARAPRSSATPGARSERATRLAAWLTGPATAAARADLYALAAASDATHLQALVAEAAAAPRSGARDVAIDALLRKYSEIDARDAVALARSVDARVDTLAALFRTWTAADKRAALGALSTLGDTATAEAVGIAVLDALGNGNIAFTKVHDALPQTARTEFRAAVLGAEARTAPAAALARALALPDANERRASAKRVAEVWAKLDGYEAISQLELIEEPRLQSSLVTVALLQWSQEDAEAVADYLAKSDDVGQQFMMAGGLQSLASLEPTRALQIAAQLPASISQALMMTALTRLAETDLDKALTYPDTLPAAQRRQALQIVARSYGHTQPDAALAWVRSMQPQPPGLLNAVLAGIAQTDAVRALDILLENPSSLMPQSLSDAFTIFMSAASDSRQAAAMADRVLTIDDARSRQQALSQLLSFWSGQHPATALTWLAAHGSALEPHSFQNIAQRLGDRDPEAAAAFTDRIPPDARRFWIGGLAAGYAQNDPEAALNWLNQYSGQPGYAEGVAAAAMSVARYDAARAARLLTSAPHAGGDVRMPTGMIAQQWARQDPAAAAAWAANLSDDSMRTQAAVAVAQSWVTQDPAAARAWVLQLPAGVARDATLGPVLAGSVRDGAPDTTLLNAFSTDTARQRGIVRMTFQVARRSPDDARQLVDRYITDPKLRQQAEAMIMSATDGGGRIGAVQNGIVYQVK